jgi:hypothetical protein
VPHPCLAWERPQHKIHQNGFGANPDAEIASPVQEWHEGMTDKDLEEQPLEGEELDEETGEELEPESEEEAFEREEEEREAKEERGGRRFGLPFGRKQETEESRKAAALGSVREGHERVHIDDRFSAIYAIVIAVILIGALFAPIVTGMLPKGKAATPAPLVVPTFKATPSPSVSPSPSLTVSASPSVAPSASASK